MLFNSHIFLFVFLPLTFGLYMLAARLRLVRLAIPLLSAASLFFYGFWNPPYLVLLLLSIGFNFFYAREILTRFREKTFVLAIGVVANLALLAYFKYTHFFISNLEAISGWSWHIGTIVLPLGISFFTFQQIAFLVDFHHGRTSETRFWHYALFVSFFPQLIAGPIVHHRDVMHQFADPERFRFNPGNVNVGLTFFSIGLFKKVVIADSLSPIAGALFNGHGSPDILSAWVGTLAYTLQIYFDFSGYSDMAIGLGRLFNIDLPLNFDSPYRSTTIAEFWRRWHMTLSRFLRDYLYIPLGETGKGPLVATSI